MVHPCDKPCGNKTANGYCATTVCINPKYSNIGTAHYGQGVQKRIITNADRIRSLSDEKLAEFLDSIVQDWHQGTGGAKMTTYKILPTKCSECLWLKCCTWFYDRDPTHCRNQTTKDRYVKKEKTE